MPNAVLTLSTVLATAPWTRALKDGVVQSDRVQLNFVDIPRVNDAYPSMVRDQAYDLCQMSPTTYLLARSLGKPITALPVFLDRHFHHGVMAYNVASGIRMPKDLEGRSAGVGSWTITTGVYGRVVLQTDYGVDLNSIRYLSFEDPHVAEYAEPAIVARAPVGKKLNDMLIAGEIDAGIAGGLPQTDDVKLLIPDPGPVEEAWYRRTGNYPLVSTVVVRDELLAEYPWLAGELFRLFEASRDTYLGALKAGTANTSADERILWQASVIGGDPLPYGVSANRHSIDLLVQALCEQEILPSALAAEELFAVV
ncbi:MAG: ABC transporter substrate-binding protein [Chloroflexota bacterium]